ncbi:hypothetical protein JTB14_012469 [Gonioctena quinquepunctata]|nr:hypothetical protein JTB14_012469 [Gonioctena quinquepunctata]
MVYKYKRKSEQQSWDGMAHSTAAETFSVPRNTLERRVLGKNIDAKGNRKVLGNYRAIFTEEQEAELVRHILDLAVRSFGVTILNLRSLAYSLAEKMAFRTILTEKQKWLAQTGLLDSDIGTPKLV